MTAPSLLKAALPGTMSIETKPALVSTPPTKQESIWNYYPIKIGAELVKNVTLNSLAMGVAVKSFEYLSHSSGTKILEWIAPIGIFNLTDTFTTQAIRGLNSLIQKHVILKEATISMTVATIVTAFASKALSVAPKFTNTATENKVYELGEALLVGYVLPVASRVFLKMFLTQAAPVEKKYHQFVRITTYPGTYYVIPKQPESVTAKHPAVNTQTQTTALPSKTDPKPTNLPVKDQQKASVLVAKQSLAGKDTKPSPTTSIPIPVAAKQKIISQLPRTGAAA